MTVTNEPRIEAYIGASGSGKGVSINARLDELKPRRLLIWDPRDEYGRHAVRHDSLPELTGYVRHAQKTGQGFRARFVPGTGTQDLGEAFGYLCRLAFIAGDLVFLAEELSDVTKPSHAPAAWRQVITQGRHQGLHVLGAAQRPALIDKNFLGNATYIRCFGLRYAPDRQAMALALDVPLPEVAQLQTTTEGKTTTVRYIERDFRAGTTRHGEKKLRRK